MMDQVIQLELIDAPGVEPNKTSSHVLEQCPQLSPMVRGDQRSRGATIGVVRRTPLRIIGLGHGRNLERW
jgi:hypothetical protein